jgi:transcriptional regulator with XRE-family HTH domain
MPPKLARLRHIRESKFLSQTELAERAGVAVTTVSRIESGKEEARYATTRKLAAALEVEPAQLVGTQTVDESSTHDVWGAEPPPTTPGEQGQEPRG